MCYSHESDKKSPKEKLLGTPLSVQKLLSRYIVTTKLSPTYYVTNGIYDILYFLLKHKNGSKSKAVNCTFVIIAQRYQTQHDYRTTLLIEKTQHVKKSRVKLGQEPHAAREPRVGYPWYIQWRRFYNNYWSGNWCTVRESEAVNSVKLNVFFMNKCVKLYSNYTKQKFNRLVVTAM